MVERPTKEWLDRVTRVFGKQRPSSVTLRGDEQSYHFQRYEICLARIYGLTRKHYKRNSAGSYYLNEKHLAEQEKTIWLLAYRFDVELDKVLDGNYDFIPRPGEGASYYEVGLADMIFVTESSELTYLLDFQFYNNVVAEKTDKVRYIQILHFYVRHYLKSKYPVVPKEKLMILNHWILEKVGKFDEEESKAFYWYELEYKFVEPEVENEHSDETIPQPNKTKKLEFPELNGKPKVKCLCSDLDTIEYFQRLTTIPVGSKKPLLSQDIVEWIVAKYFSVDSGSRRRPRIKTNLTKEELTMFMHFFAFDYRGHVNGNKNAQLKQLIVLLNEVFPETVSKEEMEICYKKAATWRNTYDSPRLASVIVKDK